MIVTVKLSRGPTDSALISGRFKSLVHSVLIALIIPVERICPEIKIEAMSGWIGEVVGKQYEGVYPRFEIDTISLGHAVS